MVFGGKTFTLHVWHLRSWFRTNLPYLAYLPLHPNTPDKRDTLLRRETETYFLCCWTFPAWLPVYILLISFNCPTAYITTKGILLQIFFNHTTNFSPLVLLCNSRGQLAWTLCTKHQPSLLASKHEVSAGAGVDYLVVGMIWVLQTGKSTAYTQYLRQINRIYTMISTSTINIQQSEMYCVTN
jgi:hypothetical protein